MLRNINIFIFGKDLLLNYAEDCNYLGYTYTFRINKNNF